MAGYIGGKAVNLSTSGADISGTANLDDVDIDGAVNMATTALVTGVLTTTAATVFNGGFASNAASSIGGNLVVSAASANIDVSDTGTSFASQDFLTNSNAARTTIGVERSSGGGLFVGSSGYAAVFGAAGAHSTQIASNNTVRMTVDSSGNVGIGTSSPSQKLHITQTASGATYPILLQNRTNGNSSVGIQFIATGSDLSDGQFASIEAIGDATGSTKHDLAFKTVASGGTPTERMRIDSTGAVTMPAQPAFSVRPAGAQNNIAVNAQVQIIWGTETFDVGGNFASNVFTAPVSGKYQFNVVVGVENLDSAATYVETVLITSNLAVYTTIDPDFGQDNAFWSFTTPVLCDMDAGDTAYVAIVQGGGAAQMDVRIYSQFSGYLVA